MLRRRAIALGLISALSWTGAGFADEPAKPAPMGQPAIIKSEGVVHDLGPCCGGCEPAACGGLQAGIGFYYIKPVWDSNPALNTLNTGASFGGFDRGRIDHFSYDFDFAPLIWIGVSDGNVGARVRFWTFDESASLSRIDDSLDLIISSAAPLGINITSRGLLGGTETITAVGDLQLEVWDLEGTYTHQLCGFDITYFGGLRYVHLSQSYNAAVVGNNTGILLQALSSGHNLNVAGLTGGVETRRAIGCTGLAVYGSSRASLLYGHSRQTAVALDLTQEVEQGIGEGADTSREDLLPILEAELGVEYSANMGSSTLFIQAGLVGQVWFGAGNNSRSSSPDVLGPAAGGTISDDNLGFFGFVIAGGIRY